MFSHLSASLILMMMVTVFTILSAAAAAAVTGLQIPDQQAYTGMSHRLFAHSLIHSSISPISSLSRSGTGLLSDSSSSRLLFAPRPSSSLLLLMHFGNGRGCRVLSPVSLLSHC
jgi:hypothetical protein